MSSADHAGAMVAQPPTWTSHMASSLHGLSDGRIERCGLIATADSTADLASARWFS